jgi:hypothetical protein
MTPATTVSNVFDPLFIVHVWGKDFKFGRPFYGEGALILANDFFEEQTARPDVTDADFLRRDGDCWVEVVPPFHRDSDDQSTLGRGAPSGVTR